MKDLILLHGALGTSQLFDPLTEALAGTFRFHRFNFSGHGNEPFSNKGCGIEAFAEELQQFVVEHALQNAAVFGYSMGGYVALYLQSYRPVFSRIITLGTKFDWSPESARHETSRLVPAIIEEKVPKFATLLAERHHDWKALMEATAKMMLDLGESPLLNTGSFNKVDIAVTIMRGDADQMVSQEESETAAQKLPKGDFRLLENCPHPIEKVDPAMLASVLQSMI